MNTVSMVVIVVVLILSLIGVLLLAERKLAKIKSDEKWRTLSRKKEAVSPTKNIKGKKSHHAGATSRPVSNGAPKQKGEPGIDDCKQKGHRWITSSQDCSRVCAVCEIKQVHHKDTYSEMSDDGFIYQICRRCGKKTYDAESSRSMGMWS